MTTQQTLDLQNLEFNYLDSEIDVDNLIYEGDGSFYLDNQSMFFTLSNGSELCCDFEISATGKIYEDRGDYYNPPYCDITVTSLDVTITEVSIDGDPFKINSDSLKELEKLIKNRI